MGFGAEHRVLGWPPVKLRVMEPRRLVAINAPWSPAEEPRVRLHRPLEVVADNGDLRNREWATEDPIERLLRGWFGLHLVSFQVGATFFSARLRLLYGQDDVIVVSQVLSSR